MLPQHLELVAAKDRTGARPELLEDLDVLLERNVHFGQARGSALLQSLAFVDPSLAEIHLPQAFMWSEEADGSMISRSSTEG